jgi:hypothetical protein
MQTFVHEYDTFAMGSEDVDTKDEANGSDASRRLQEVELASTASNVTSDKERLLARRSNNRDKDGLVLTD